MVWELLMEALGDKINIYVIITILVGIIMTSKLDMCQDKLKIKIPIIYILFYLFAITNIVSKKILLILFIIYTFVFLEFVFIDTFTRKFIKKVQFNILDYLYKIFFDYNFFYFFASLFLIRIEHSNWVNAFIMVGILGKLTKKVWEKYNIRKVIIVSIIMASLMVWFLINNINILNTLITIASILILLKGILSSINNEFEAIGFEEVFNKINNILPIYQFKLNRKFVDFSKILILKEDRSYFKRKKSYNWVSLEFLVYRLKRLYANFLIVQTTNTDNKLQEKLKFIKFIFSKLILQIKPILKDIKNIILNVWIKRKSIKKFFRGYSTIEMQLIRTLAIKDGYEKHVCQRKFFEIIYSKIYFESLKDYYEYNIYVNSSQFKYYLIFLYINVAPVYINRKRYINIFDLYDKKCLDDITIEEFYIWSLGISNTPITNINKGYMSVYKMDENKINKIIEELS